MKMNDPSRFFKGILNTVNDGLLLVGPDGSIQMVNPALERLTGFSKEELLGKPCTFLNCDICIHSRTHGGHHWCTLFDEKTVHRRRCNIIRKDGTSLPVLKNASLLMEDGKVVAAVETLTDISELLARDNRIEELSRLLEPEHGFHGMIGASPAMRRVYRMLEKASESASPVLIQGESGTGKELAARAIHDLRSAQLPAPRPFIQLNCAALNESLFESELFGHVRGAFTGAVTHRKGRFEAAHRGDIFLDEIGDIPLTMQVKLLRVLETKLIERVGDNQPIQVDVRVISATHRNLQNMVKEGAFRQDLLFRINVIPIQLPPLRERKEDIPLLIGHFLKQYSESSRQVHISPEAMRIIMSYSWPGNIRELKSAIEYALVQEDHGRIEPCHLPAQLHEPIRETMVPRRAPDEAAHGPNLDPRDISDEREALVQALRQSGGNKSQAARLLDIHRGTVIYRMRKYGIDLKKEVIG